MKNFLSGRHIKSKVVCDWSLSLWYRAVYLFCSGCIDTAGPWEILSGQPSEDGLGFFFFEG